MKKVKIAGSIIKFEIWKVYTWLCNIGYYLMEFLPLTLRTKLFRLFFGKLGKNPLLIDYRTYFRYPSKIEIGTHVSINRGCCFLASAHSGNKRDIIIGNYCVFGPNVKLLTAGHDYHSLNLPDTFGQIEIGDYVWIGEGATIMQGVRIGTGGVIGAESVITRDVPPWTVWAGNPARQINVRDIKK